MRIWERLQLFWYLGFSLAGGIIGGVYGLASAGPLGAFGWAILGIAAGAIVAGSLDLLLKLLSQLL